MKNTLLFDEPLSPLHAVSLGIAARTLSGCLLIPITVVKTRYESGVYKYNSISQALMLIYKYEGVRGLSSGLLPTLLRDAPYSGLYLMFYTQLKNMSDTGNNKPAWLIIIVLVTLFIFLFINVFLI